MSLTIYPAIDLKGGRVVRLRRGEMDQATVYSEDPAAQAASFAGAGFRWLHVVDLDGAFAGRPANAAAVRDMATLESWLEAGVARVILGSAAAKDPDFARSACRAYPGCVAIGIDAKGGHVATEGWAEVGEMTARELALRFEDAGAAAIIHTDIDRDGMLGGVNVEATAALGARLTTPVIASGGVAGVEDITAVREAGTIEGVIVGRALYDGRLTPAQALAAAG